jgi:glycerophosphoryl diester phosphodiesterase
MQMNPAALLAIAMAQPIVIGHRGASGHMPEHTLAAYSLAIEQGADFIEPDLVMTKDGVLVARHENEIGATTDVADHHEFASRKTTKAIDGVSVTGWFTEDFTLAELKTLRARERIPQLRPGNTRFDGRFEVPTFDEVLALARAAERGRDAPIGVYPETKHPTYFASLGLSMSEPLLAALTAHGYRSRDALVFIQSFEVGNLRELRSRTQLRLVQLIEAEGVPYDLATSNNPRTYAELLTPAGLASVAAYADAIGVHKSLVIPRRLDGTLAAPTPLVRHAHAAGLAVHGWTFRAENEFLPRDFRSGTDPAARGDLIDEIDAYLEAGIDGFFTDHPELGVAARDAFVKRVSSRE